jgi:predicted membrane protein
MINYSEENSKKNRSNNFGSRNAIAVGIILVALGCIIFLYNAGVIPWGIKHLLISWQMLLILLGIFSLASENKIAGIVLILIGGFFIIPRLNGIFPNFILFGPSFTRNFWPLLIVVTGILIIASSRKEHNWFISTGGKVDGYSSENKDGSVNYSFVFGGTEQVFPEPVFKGGSIKTVFGGMTLDLRRSSLPEDGPVYLKIETTFGGVTIIVPEQWSVEIHQNSFMGGFADRRYTRPSYINNKQKLIIDAKCTFGGGDIK